MSFINVESEESSVPKEIEKTSSSDYEEYVPIFKEEEAPESNQTESMQYVPVMVKDKSAKGNLAQATFENEKIANNLADSTNYNSQTIENESGPLSSSTSIKIAVENENGPSSSSTSINKAEENRMAQESKTSEINDKDSDEKQSKSSFELFVESVNPLIEKIKTEFQENQEFVDRVGDLMTQLAEQTQNYLQPVLEERLNQRDDSYSCHSNSCSIGQSPPLHFAPVFNGPFNRPMFVRFPHSFDSETFIRPRRLWTSPCGFKSHYSSPLIWERSHYRSPVPSQEYNFFKSASEKQQNQEISEETFQERVKQVQDMGFGDREVITELLRRYEGNVARVVD
ncbi:hypothetical protein HK096_010863, partial [Nowakowskiella sp. JEL0078]